MVLQEKKIMTSNQYFFVYKIMYLPVFSKAAVRDDGPKEGKEVAEHDKGMVDGSGTVLIEL